MIKNLKNGAMCNKCFLIGDEISIAKHCEKEHLLDKAKVKEYIASKVKERGVPMK